MGKVLVVWRYEVVTVSTPGLPTLYTCRLELHHAMPRSPGHPLPTVTSITTTAHAQNRHRPSFRWWARWLTDVIAGNNHTGDQLGPDAPPWAPPWAEESWGNQCESHRRPGYVPAMERTTRPRYGRSATWPSLHSQRHGRDEWGRWGARLYRVATPIRLPGACPFLSAPREVGVGVMGSWGGKGAVTEPWMRRACTSRRRRPHRWEYRSWEGRPRGSWEGNVRRSQQTSAHTLSWWLHALHWWCNLRHWKRY